MLGMESGVLLGSVVSCSLLCMMFRAGSTRIEVKVALYHVMTWFPPVDFGQIWPHLYSAGVSNMVGGSTYQRSKDVCHFVSYSVHD